MKFEELLPEGKKLHELTDEELDELMAKIPPEKLSEAESAVRKSSRKVTSRTTSAAQKKRENEFNNLLLKGLKK